MANTYTTRLNLTKPEVGADTNAWGGHLNANLDTIDSNILSLSIATTQTMTGALALPSNGLNVGSGQLNVTGGNVSMSGNASAVNGTFSGTLGVTGAGTFSSTVTASTAPTVGGHLTNKTYVDGQDALKLDLSGGTLTGALTLAADPVSSLQPVTRQFFYSRSISTGTGLTGGGDLSANRTISISSGGVSATELASNAVTTVKITDANVTPAKLSQPFTMATEVSTSTGTTASFTSIPSWVNRIIIMLNNVGTTAAADIYVRIGPSGGVETTGYSSAVSYGGSSVNVTSSSTFSFLVPGVGSGSNGTYQFNGHAMLTRISGNTWIMSSNIISTTTNSYYSSASRKTLAGSLSVLSIITAGTFAQGSVNITYE